MAAMFHDLSEHKTGDIPSPAKKEYKITIKTTINGNYNNTQQ